ncbi:MAG: DNA-directed RNA polymerase subunit B [Candidatus Diapherotrites archaeon]|nr:DNA-directed RNA polymerase subunit B [Candidatus Diapherotrites archaeon]
MEGASVYLNGKLIGFHNKPTELVENLRRKRRAGALPHELNAAYYAENDEVYINTDAGRARRPLLVLENGKLKLTQKHIEELKADKIGWKDLLNEGVVEYLDSEEEENAYIAVREEDATPEHTHVEVHPSLMLGVVAACAPFPDHNSSPRVTMASAMLKQALGVYQSNYALRMDTQSHVMHYPQKPLARTKHAEIIGSNDRPAGQNIVLAIMPFGGYNMEDALILNKASVERGLGRTTFYRTYTAEERRYPGGQKDRFELPKPEIQGYRGDEAYRFLGEDGIILPECKVDGGDVLIGKTSPPRFLEEVGELSMIEEKRRENSVTLRPSEAGDVDAVIVTEATTGNKLVKVRVRSLKIPEIGDKFASRHGQKGVVGMIVPQHDMPFTENGITPDIIMNPHAVPSRMTVGHVLEVLGSKAVSLEGEDFLNATAFDRLDYGGLKKMLLKHGFRHDGKEVLYNGVTGEKIEAEIFIGVCYYQRLKHLVSNKIHARSRGPVQILTRQPTEGRAREGGLRFGEMERDTLIGHGTSMLLLERLLKESDIVTELICEKCGTIAVDDQIRKKQYCPICESTNVKPIEMSYAFKLLLNELKALNIRPKVVLEDKA